MGIADPNGAGHDDDVRVLQLVAADWWTGAAATALQLAEALRSAGVDCHFAFRGGRGLDARLRGEPWATPLLRKIDSPGTFVASVRTVKRFSRDFDIVHTHLPHDHLLARAARAPVVVRSIRNPAHLPRHAYYRWLLRGVRGLGLANTTMVAAVARSRSTGGVPRTVLPPALEPRFRPDAAGTRVREVFGIPADAVVVGTIGKLDSGRGHDLFLDALARACGVWGMVIGTGPLAESLARRAAAAGIADRVAWPGYVEDGLEALYAAMDLFVFPAPGSDWGHRAIVEAAGCGVPALTADLPGTHDLVQPGSTGDLFPPGDVETLAALIREWSRDGERRRGAGAAAAARARREWTDARLATTCLELYRACVRHDREFPAREGEGA